MARQIILDTETTGLDWTQGNRVIEIGCVEVIDRKLTANNFHQYINPERDSEEKALEVHGLTTDFLSDKPLFHQIAEEFFSYVKGAELVIHNAPFDVGFLNHELRRVYGESFSLAEHCVITDTLALAKARHPGQRNSLDALCKRYDVDKSHRGLHGALLDVEILADVFLAMTGGQTSLLASTQGDMGSAALAEDAAVRRVDAALAAQVQVLLASDEEMLAHEAYLASLRKKAGRSLWDA